MIGNPIIEGVKLGLLLSMMIGPVFFALMTTSLTYGFRQSFMLALGVLASDLLYVIGTYLGVHFLTQIPSIEKYLGLVGGIILIGFGISFMVKKVILIAKELHQGQPKKRKAFLQGFGINGINPFVMLFWLSIASMVSIKSSWGTLDRAFFYTALLFTVFGFDLAKAFLADKLAHLMSLRLRKSLQVFAGLMICFFGFRMLWNTLNTVL